MADSDRSTLGLQLERTALAWRRTALALAVGSCAAARLVLEWRGPAAYAGCALLLVAGAAASLAMARTAASRYAAARRVSSSPADGLPTGGRTLALAAAVLVVVGLSAAAVVGSRAV